MKILITADPEIPVPPKFYGGIERIIDVLVNGYVAGGHEVTLFAHKSSEVPCRLISWKKNHSTGLGNSLVNTQQLFAHVIRESYDVIHSFSRLAYLTPLLPLSIPKVMSYQREPTVSQIKKAERLAKKSTLLFTGCSNYITDQIKPFAKATTVYNCVPIEKYLFTDTIAPDAPLMFLGRVEFIKGAHIAVEVAQKTRRRLIIGGNIPAEANSYFEEKIKPYLNNRIKYVGPLNDTQKAELLAQAEGFLMPVQWNEPFGIVMAEAMACGTPVIGFPLGSIPEVVTDGVTGFVCSNIEDMITKVNRLSKIDRLRVRQEAIARFSDREIVSQYLNLYANIAKPKLV